MARLDQILDALKYQIYKFASYVNTNYTGGAGDVSSASVYHIEPFDPANAGDYSPILGTSNYAFIVTNFQGNNTEDYPTQFLRLLITADIVIVRKTSRTKDRTNDRNLMQFGGTNDAGGVITSIERLATDMQKWFRNTSHGGKLVNAASEENAFLADVQDVGILQVAESEGKTSDLYYKILKFECMTMESTTISAT